MNTSDFAIAIVDWISFQASLPSLAMMEADAWVIFHEPSRPNNKLLMSPTASSRKSHWTWSSTVTCGIFSTLRQNLVSASMLGLNCLSVSPSNGRGFGKNWAASSLGMVFRRCWSTKSSLQSCIARIAPHDLLSILLGVDVPSPFLGRPGPAFFKPFSMSWGVLGLALSSSSSSMIRTWSAWGDDAVSPCFSELCWWKCW